MLIGDQAKVAVGMPDAFAEQFLAVAEQMKTIIISRASGKYAKTLIEESYASKGFHNKAKSCNWGPMAGFVNEEPIFSKVGLYSEGQAKQKKAIAKAKKVGASTIRLMISDARRQWLEDNNLISLVSDSNPDGGDVAVQQFVEASSVGTHRPQVKKYTAVLRHVNGDPTPLDRAANMTFFLRRRWELKSDGKTTSVGGTWVDQQLWEVFYQDPNEAILPVMAMVDPNFKNYTEITFPEHKLATTADFDLFATWAYAAKIRSEIARMRSEGKTEDADAFERVFKKMDMRPASTLMLKNYDYTGQFEDSELGNITPRLRLAKRYLNEAFRTNCGYVAGEIVHHSDEAGRPAMEEIDMPIIIFLPKDSGLEAKYGHSILVIEGDPITSSTSAASINKQEFKTFVDDCLFAGYKVSLNPGWAKVLGDKYMQYVIASDPQASPFNPQNMGPQAHLLLNDS